MHEGEFQFINLLYEKSNCPPLLTTEVLLCQVSPGELDNHFPGVWFTPDPRLTIS